MWRRCVGQARAGGGLSLGHCGVLGVNLVPGWGWASLSAHRWVPGCWVAGPCCQRPSEVSSYVDTLGILKVPSTWWRDPHERLPVSGGGGRWGWNLEGLVPPSLLPPGVPAPLPPYPSLFPLQLPWCGSQWATPKPFGGWGTEERGGRRACDYGAGGGLHLPAEQWGAAWTREIFHRQSSGSGRRKASWWWDYNQPLGLHQRWFCRDGSRLPWVWGPSQWRDQQMAQVGRRSCGCVGVPHSRWWRWKALVCWRLGRRPSRCIWLGP